MHLPNVDENACSISRVFFLIYSFVYRIWYADIFFGPQITICVNRGCGLRGLLEMLLITSTYNWDLIHPLLI
jgi:hypothetical protein